MLIRLKKRVQILNSKINTLYLRLFLVVQWIKKKKKQQLNFTKD
jgi:hypothetical protein